MDNSPDILYICDRKQCGDVCPNPDCSNTQDINHAVNFKRYDDQGSYFVEGGWPNTDKPSALSRLTFCCECKLWKPTTDKKIQPEYRNQIGVCNRPYEHMVTRWYDDFCSSGRPNDRVYIPDKEEIIDG